MTCEILFDIKLENNARSIRASLCWRYEIVLGLSLHFGVMLIIISRESIFLILKRASLLHCLDHLIFFYYSTSIVLEHLILPNYKSYAFSNNFLWKKNVTIKSRWKSKAFPTWIWLCQDRCHFLIERRWTSKCTLHPSTTSQNIYCKSIILLLLKRDLDLLSQLTFEI